MTVEDLKTLRGKLRESQSELRVTKNNLSRRALEHAQCDSLDDLLVGPVALAYCFGDPSGLAKTCIDYAKTNEKLVIKGGLLDKKRIAADKLQALAKLPGRPQLLAQMAGTLMAPARQMATALNQAMAKVVYAMKARADQMEPQA
jgi:large subunit ribosomal protein L10